MIGKRVQINSGCGYWDTTIYSYGGFFRRATDSTVGVVLETFPHKGQHARIMLDDGRTAVARVEHVTIINKGEA